MDLLSFLSLFYHNHVISFAYYLKYFYLNKFINKFQEYVILNPLIHGVFQMCILLIRTIFLTHMFSW